MAGQVLIGESPNDKEDGEAHKTHELNRFASNDIDGRNGHPVSRYRARNYEDAVASGEVVENFVNIWSSAITNSGEHSGGVETETVELEVRYQYPIRSL